MALAKSLCAASTGHHERLTANDGGGRLVRDAERRSQEVATDRRVEERDRLVGQADRGGQRGGVDQIGAAPGLEPVGLQQGGEGEAGRTGCERRGRQLLGLLGGAGLAR